MVAGQSLAVGLDHPAIEPAHLMQALLEQQGVWIKPLLTQVGFDVNSLRKERPGARSAAKNSESDWRRKHVAGFGTSVEPGGSSGAAKRRPVHHQRSCIAGGDDDVTVAGQVVAGSGVSKKALWCHQQPAWRRSGQ